MSSQIAVIKATLKYQTQEELIRGMAPLITKRGFFIHTRQTRPVGSEIQFEFQLADGSQTYTGEGIVRKEVPFNADSSKQKSGMLVALRRVNRPFKEVVDAVLSSKEEQEIAAQAEMAKAAAEPTASEAPAAAPVSNYSQHIVDAHAGDFDLFGDMDMDEGLDSLFSNITSAPSKASKSNHFDNFFDEKLAETDCTPMEMDAVSQNILDTEKRYGAESGNDLSKSTTGQFEAVEEIAKAERAVYEQSALIAANGTRWNPNQEEQIDCDKDTPVSGLKAVSENDSSYNESIAAPQYGDALLNAQSEMASQTSELCNNDPFAAQNELAIETEAVDGTAAEQEMPAEPVQEPIQIESHVEPAFGRGLDVFTTQPLPAMSRYDAENDARSRLAAIDAGAADNKLAAVDAETAENDARSRLAAIDAEAEKSHSIFDQPASTFTGFPSSAAEETPSELFAALQSDILGMPSSDNPVIPEEAVEPAENKTLGILNKPFEIASKPFEIASKPFEIASKPFEIGGHQTQSPEPRNLNDVLASTAAKLEPKPEPIQPAATPAADENDAESPIAAFTRNAARRTQNREEPATLESLLKQADVKSKDIIMTDVNPRKATPRKRNAEDTQPSIPTQEKKGGFLSSLFKK